MRFQQRPSVAQPQTDDAPPAGAGEFAPRPPAPRVTGVVIGRLRGFDSFGVPWVDFPGSPTGGPLAARTTAPVGAADVGRDVALSFEDGDPHKPIVLGPLCQPVPGVSADADRLVLSAPEAIEFRCGKASITLTKAGKIILHSEYVLSRSTGANCIKGGSVQIN